MEPANHTFLELRSEQRPRLLAHILGDRHGRQFGLCRQFVTDFALAAVLKPRFDRGRTEPLAHFAPALGVLTRPQFLQTGSNISLMTFAGAGGNREGKVSDCDLAFVSMNFARSEEHTSALQSLMRISNAVFCLKRKKT